jgi:hypothetical protein
MEALEFMSVTSPAARSAAVVASASISAARLRQWLLHGPAQVATGEQAGGIAGAIAADGKPRYVYAEITGYYLSWLADIAGGEDNGLLKHRAQRALDWSAREFARPGQAALTRIYLDPATDPDAASDWRNNALFFFDLAMLLHGVDAAAAAGIGWPAAGLRRTLHDHLLQFVQNGSLTCALQTRGTQALPQRWSTQGGPFLVKASSRVAFGPRHASRPVELAAACEAESDRWASGVAEIDLGMLHPTLYFAEGMLLSRPDRAAQVARLLRRCLALVGADGSLPETADGSCKVRNDIIAQALRVAVLLRNANVSEAPDQRAIDNLAQTLIARIGEQDYLAFNAESFGQPNIWCTLFAEQALRWYADAAPRSGPHPSAAALV